MMVAAEPCLIAFQLHFWYYELTNGNKKDNNSYRQDLMQTERFPVSYFNQGCKIIQMSFFASKINLFFFFQKHVPSSHLPPQ